MKKIGGIIANYVIERYQRYENRMKLILVTTKG